VKTAIKKASAKMEMNMLLT